VIEGKQTHTYLSCVVRPVNFLECPLAQQVVESHVSSGGGLAHYFGHFDLLVDIRDILQLYAVCFLLLLQLLLFLLLKHPLQHLLLLLLQRLFDLVLVHFVLKHLEAFFFGLPIDMPTSRAGRWTSTQLIAWCGRACGCSRKNARGGER